jgi:hypothetical protein
MRRHWWSREHEIFQRKGLVRDIVVIIPGNQILQQLISDLLQFDNRSPNCFRCVTAATGDIELITSSFNARPIRSLYWPSIKMKDFKGGTRLGMSGMFGSRPRP